MSLIFLLYYFIWHLLVKKRWIELQVNFMGFSKGFMIFAHSLYKAVSENHLLWFYGFVVCQLNFTAQTTFHLQWVPSKLLWCNLRLKETELCLCNPHCLNFLMFCLTFPPTAILLGKAGTCERLSLTIRQSTNLSLSATVQKLRGSKSIRVL